MLLLIEDSQIESIPEGLHAPADRTHLCRDNKKREQLRPEQLQLQSHEVLHHFLFSSDNTAFIVAPQHSLQNLSYETMKSSSPSLMNHASE